MADQPRKDPYEPSAFYADGASARRPVPDTVIWTKGAYVPPYPAQQGGPEATTFPFALTKDDLKRGQERYDIYCAVCHGRTGEGDGMIVQRGFARPPAYFPIAAHKTQFPDLYQRESNLVNTTPGHIYNVITNGYGAMYSYAARVAPDDRWRIAGYVKALQLSRSIKPEQLPPDDRAKLQASVATNATINAGQTTQPLRSGTGNQTSDQESTPR